MICVNVSGQLQRVEEVAIAAIPLSAQPGLDYVFNSSSINFTQAVSQVCVPFVVLSDDIVEEQESVLITIDSPSAIIPVSNVTVTITDSSTVAFSFDMDVYSTTENESIAVCVGIFGGQAERDIQVVLAANNTGNNICLL